MKVLFRYLTTIWLDKFFLTLVLIIFSKILKWKIKLDRRNYTVKNGRDMIW